MLGKEVAQLKELRAEFQSAVEVRFYDTVASLACVITNVSL